MKKLLFMAVLASAVGANAQKWVKSTSRNAELEDVYYYVSEGDTIAKKWTNIYDNERFVTSIRKKDYIELWRLNDNNYMSLVFENNTIQVEKGSYYNIVVVMDDNSQMVDMAYVTKTKGSTNIVFTLPFDGVHILKNRSIKGIKIEGAVEDYVLDSKENELDTDFVRTCANIVWPDKPKEKV